MIAKRCLSPLDKVDVHWLILLKVLTDEVVPSHVFSPQLENSGVFWSKYADGGIRLEHYLMRSPLLPVPNPGRSCQLAVLKLHLFGWCWIVLQNLD